MVTRFRFAVAAGAAVVALACPAVRPVLAQDEPPQIVKRAVADYAANHRGNLAFSRHLTFAMQVGPLKKNVRNEIGILMRDGEYVKTKYYSAETNGKPDGDAALRREEQKANDDLAAGRGFFKRPIDPRFVDDYKFEVAACACGREEEKVKFTSLVRDAQHGDGTMVIDKNTGHVQTIEYDMNKPPDHASNGHAVETYGEAISGLWTCTKVEETYDGRVGFVGGTASLSYTLDHFKRFAQSDAALAAITNRTL